MIKMFATVLVSLTFCLVVNATPDMDAKAALALAFANVDRTPSPIPTPIPPSPTRCECSSACTCGCNEGLPCTCAGSVSKPITPSVQVYSTPQYSIRSISVPTIQRPTYNYAPTQYYAPRNAPMQPYRGGVTFSRGGGGC